MKRYEVRWAHLDPTRGAEMAKTRPVVIVSLDALNERLVINHLEAIMPTDDRKDTMDEIRADANPPVEDLSPNALDERAASQVKGGSTGAGAGKVTFNPFSITRKIDKSSPSIG